jgi:hypothetical protein
MEVGDQLHAPAALPPGKDPLVPIGWEAGWAPYSRGVKGKCGGISRTASGNVGDARSV